MDSIVQILKETCTTKLKANAVKQEHEKQDELRRSAIRAFVSIYKIPEAGTLNSLHCTLLLSIGIFVHFYPFFPDKNAFANEMMNLIKTSTDLKPLFESVQNSNKINEAFLPMEVEFN